MIRVYIITVNKRYYAFYREDNNEYQQIYYKGEDYKEISAAADWNTYAEYMQDEVRKDIEDIDIILITGSKPEKYVLTSLSDAKSFELYSLKNTLAEYIVKRGLISKNEDKIFNIENAFFYKTKSDNKLNISVENADRDDNAEVINLNDIPYGLEMDYTFLTDDEERGRLSNNLIQAEQKLKNAEKKIDDLKKEIDDLRNIKNNLFNTINNIKYKCLKGLRCKIKISLEDYRSWNVYRGGKILLSENISNHVRVTKGQTLFHLVGNHFDSWEIERSINSPKTGLLIFGESIINKELTSINSPETGLLFFDESIINKELTNEETENIECIGVIYQEGDDIRDLKEWRQKNQRPPMERPYSRPKEVLRYRLKDLQITKNHLEDQLKSIYEYIIKGRL